MGDSENSVSTTESYYSTNSWKNAGADVPEVLDSIEIEPSLKGAEAAGGSTGALRIEYEGNPYIYKSNKPNLVVNEFVAFKLYAAADGRVPRAHLVINSAAGGIPQAVLIQLVPGVTVANALRENLLLFGQRITLYESIKSDFLLHALFANWDTKNSENHIIPTTRMGEYQVNTPYTIDLGGALFYRASGEHKPIRYFTRYDMDELEEIPTQSAVTSSRLFTYPTEGDLREPHILYQNVCNRMMRIKRDDILAEIARLQTLQTNTLFDFYPAGFDLHKIVSSRLTLVENFCKRGKLRESISAAATQIERGPTPFYTYRTNIHKGEKFDKYGKVLYNTIVTSLKDEVFEKLEMKERRTLVDLGGVTAEEAAHIELVKPALPSTRRRYAGAAGGAAAGNWDDDDYLDETNDNATTGFPEPRVTITLDGTATAMSLKHKMIAARTDPKLRAWLEAQTAFILTGLSNRERNILISYTRHGDRLANNYLRRTLRDDLHDLMSEIIAGPTDYPHYSVPLAYSLLDQIDTLMREKKHLLAIPDDWVGDRRKPSSLLLGGGADGSEVSMEAVAAFMEANRAFFDSPRQIESLLAQYVRDLYEIMKKAPRAPHTFTVFRGFKSDSYLTSLDFRAVDFLSTSLSPETVYNHFLFHKSDARIMRLYSGSVYEMNVSPSVPCIYMESMSQFPGEFEILIPPGVIVETDDKVYMKYYAEKPYSLSTILDESRPTGNGKFVAVVECAVRLPKTGERGGQLVALGDMRVRDSIRDVSERFSSVKPRGERVGRGHKKRITWKAERRAGRLRKTRRVSSRL